MSTFNIRMPQPLARLVASFAAAGLCLGLVGCVDGPERPAPPPVNPDPDACAWLPVLASHWKGGNSWGEELTVALDPETMAYTVSIDASVQRTAGTEFSGTLIARDDQDCVYDNDSADAVFTLAAGGVLLGSVTAPDGNGQAPLLAFANTFSNADTPEVFNPVTFIGNVIGVEFDGATWAGFSGSSRLRNAGTLQTCLLAGTAEAFAVYDNGCMPRERGYMRYDAGRDAFDRYATDPAVNTPTSGGDLAGSVIIGQPLAGAPIMMELVREPSRHGMRLHISQADPLALAFAHYSALDGEGNEGHVDISAAEMVRETQAATVTLPVQPNHPVDGVIAVDGGAGGHLLLHAGIYAFAPAGPGLPVFELGVDIP